MKLCPTCKLEKPLDAFSKNKTRKDGLASQCKTCKNVVNASWRAENQAKINATQTKWRDENRDKLNAAAAVYAAVYHFKLKAKTLDVYGGPVCACCGRTEPEIVLSIDHINGDGAEHRQDVFSNYKRPELAGGQALWRWLRDNNWPTGYQVLCKPCNSSKKDTPACRLDHVA